MNPRRLLVTTATTALLACGVATPALAFDISSIGSALATIGGGTQAAQETADASTQAPEGASESTQTPDAAPTAEVVDEATAADVASSQPAADAAATAAVAPEPVDLSSAGNVDLSTAAAIGMGQQVSDVVIEETTQSKFYTFTFDQSGCVELDVTAQWHDWDAAYTLYDATGTALWAMQTDSDWNETTAQAVSSYDIDLTSGTYYLEVRHANWHDGETGAYTFTTAFTPAQESMPETQGGSNNALDAASDIQLGQQYTGQIAINDRSDFYRFTLAEPGSITLSATTFFEPRFDAVYHLYDEAGEELWEKYIADDFNETTGQAVSSSEIALTAGTYYFVVEQTSDDSPDWGTYAFSVAFAPAAESFPESAGGVNSSLAQASPIELGAVYNGQLALNDGVDFYAFSMPEAGTLHLDLESTWHTYQDTMFIYDASGNEMWKHSNDGDWNETTARAATSQDVELGAGTYYLAVQQQGDAYGNYSFALSTASVPVAGAVAAVSTQAAPVTAAASAPGAAAGGEQAQQADAQAGVTSSISTGADQSQDTASLPVADGTYTSSATGSLGSISMTITIEGGQLTNVSASVEAGITPDEYAQLLDACIAQARQA